MSINKLGAGANPFAGAKHHGGMSGLQSGGQSQGAHGSQGAGSAAGLKPTQGAQFGGSQSVLQGANIGQGAGQFNANQPRHDNAFVMSA